ncbi:ParM/StbA family protein [Sinomonas mesophila]|uniref:ParM/StbA family protein n=1 Tax=Sinomonas mesophila TaxID=1531955 RepID=UPI00098713CC|nr:ParM/StbA family protein [Sinomonas mesophila]
MTISTQLTGGIDVGNGYVKGIIRGAEDDGAFTIDEIDLPSGVALVTRSNAMPTADGDAGAKMDGDFYNELDVSFASPLIGDQYRRLFGTRALSAQGAFDEFDVVGRRSKAQQELSKVLVMGAFAAKALRDYVRQNGALPPADETLSVQARVALALPINEYMAHRTSYAAEFTTGTHTATIHNFDTPVTVNLRFVDVQVIPEGASAQYAITVKGESLMDAMLADVRRRGVALEGITSADVLAAQHSVGIDIGEGTVNFPVFTAGKFNADASTTYKKGYGSVLTDALKSMADRGFDSGFTSRKQLAEYLQAGPSPLKRNFYNKVAQFVEEEMLFFSKEVAEQFGRVLAVVGATTEVAYVYGGGSGPVKDFLYPALLAKATEMNSEDAFPTLYLDSSYSRHLNREGLYIAALTVEDRETSAAPASTTRGKRSARVADTEEGKELTAAAV